MKLKVIVIKRKYIYICIISIILLIILLNIFSSNKESSIPTMSIIDKTQFMQLDLTGDGYKDIVYVKPENNNYYVQIRTKTDSIQLIPIKSKTSLGNYYEHWPMNITFKDISGDNLPEIFTQSCEEISESLGTVHSSYDSTDNFRPIQTLFIKKNNDFENIYYSNSNIIGFNSNKNKFDFYSGNYSKDTINLNKCVLVNNKIQTYKLTKNKIVISKDIMTKFINNITNNEFDTFIKYINSSDNKTNKLIQSLSQNKSSLIFQDGIFINNGNLINYRLNFKHQINEYNTKNYTFTIDISILDQGNYDISTISIENRQ